MESGGCASCVGFYRSHCSHDMDHTGWSRTIRREMTTVDSHDFFLLILLLLMCFVVVVVFVIFVVFVVVDGDGKCNE